MAPVVLVAAAFGADTSAEGDLEVAGVESEDDITVDGASQVVDANYVYVLDVPE